MGFFDCSYGDSFCGDCMHYKSNYKKDCFHSSNIKIHFNHVKKWEEGILPASKKNYRNRCKDFERKVKTLPPTNP